MMEKANNINFKPEISPPKLTLMGYFRHHIFALKQCLQNITNTPIVSLITLFIIAFSITLPLILWLFFSTIQTLTHSWETTQISIYLQTNTDENNIQNLIKQIQTLKKVDKLEYISKEQGIKNFEKQTGLTHVLDALQNNPLPDVIILHPTPGIKTLNEIQSLINDVKKFPYIETIQWDSNWIERLNAFSQIGKSIVFGLAIILSIGVLLIIINAIRSISQTVQTKIHTIKLLGGSNRFIRRPFLYMGLFYSLIGCYLAIIATNYCAQILNELMQQINYLYHIEIKLPMLPNEIISLSLLISGLLGYLGAWLSLMNQLRNSENY